MDPIPNEPAHCVLSIDLDCPWCLTATIDALEADPTVQRVPAHSAAGCLEVSHTGPPDAILATITGIGHTIELASNGEAVMAPARVRVEQSCARHPTPSVGRVRIGEPR